MIRIKICGLTRPQDAQAACRAGADAVGMVFAPSSRRVNIRQAAGIIAVLPPSILRVGVFTDQDPDWIKKLMDQLGLDRLQFHGQAAGRHLRQFPVSRVWRAMQPDPQALLPCQDPEPAAAALVVDAYVPGQAGGTGQLANWKFAAALHRLGKPLILAGGLTSQNVATAIQQVKPDMVDVSSGVEDEPGIKNPRKILAFIRTVRGFDQGR